MRHVFWMAVFAALAATVFGIVNQHAGFIDVASEVNQGTTFTIELPAAESTVQV